MSDHYSTPKPTSAPKYDSYTFPLDGREVAITTVSGVFGKGGLDRGSEVLFTYADVSRARTLLDLGCGTGVVGIALALKHPELEVTFADVNERAVSIARTNAQRNGVRASFKVSDGFSKLADRFDAIVFNPPQSAGKAICERLIAEAKDHLTPEGRLFVVARHQKGGKSLMAFMESVYGPIETLARKSGYRVYATGGTMNGA